ncbi:GntR family transcriptional regulator [Kordiimonas gwangyangensis]|uniref:GntR family transcriptional regulator n=1 Tax=Kordiimonas gwangyangensis TaxID=288022 RepID=UPI000375D06A|nr:GntR family transcriptional regulator [Kordiimonas gwangyangensis]
MSKNDINFDKLARVTGETAQEWVYRALRFAVMSGQVQPGRALTIRGIAEMLNVSAMPVREALRRLTSEGALELKSNRRIMVPDLSPASLAELLELRILLEVHAAERALPYVTPDKLRELNQLNDEQNRAFEDPQPEGIIIGNQAFHRALYTAHPHPVSMPMIERIWLQLGPLHRLALANLETHYVTDRHVEIMQAIETRNPFGLKAAIEADIRDGAGYMTQTELLERYTRAEAGNLALPGKEYMKRLVKK